MSGGTKCSDFLKAPPDQQLSVVNTLAAHYRLPDYSGGNGISEMTYECSALPNATLGQRYQHAAVEYGGQPSTGSANDPAAQSTGSANDPAAQSTGSANDPATPSAAGASGPPVNACMVLDTGGVDDKSFNQASWDGLQAAAKAQTNISASYAASNTSNDYTPNLTAQTNASCDTIIAVGGLMAVNVKKIATANPSQHYAEIDSPSTAPNVYGLQYDTAQGAFLGGYLAAAMSHTGTVGTWGGINIPQVTIYMDGYWEGVQYYNKQNKKNVKVLGWNEKDQKGGTFAGSFIDQDKGKAITKAMEQQGADIVFPVAGGAGLGAGAAARASGGKLNLLWLDTDGCASEAQYCPYFISSVIKGVTTSVETYMSQVAEGTFPSGNYIGSLANGGTGLAPFHQWESKVPAAVKSQLQTVTKDVESGQITITSPNQPK